MPAPRGRAGGTYVDPFKNLGGQTTTPRLFSRKQAAESALEWWLKGKVNVTWRGWAGEEDREITGQTPVPGRNADEWSVIEVALKAV